MLRTDDQERKNKEVDAKGEKLKARLAEERLSATGTEAETTDIIIEQLEEKRDLSRVIALIDAGQFLVPRSILGCELTG